MRKYLLNACVAALAMAAATPAAAAVVVYDGNEYDVGETITIDFVGSAGDQFEGLAGTLTLTLQAPSGGNDYIFAYSIMNTATDPDQQQSELSGFGFNIDPDIDGATENGPLSVSSGSISNGTKLEFCLTAGSNCAGGSSNGDEVGGGGFEGFFTLLFDGTDPAMITITNPITRFQVTGANGEGSGVGTPGGTPPVPEPGTWGMMLMGFGAAGFAIRRRRRSVSLPQVA